MSSQFKNCILGLALVLLATGASAQHYFFQRFSLEDGLPQSEVWFNSLLKDGRGHLWAGTNGGGVVRLDGRQMRHFTVKDGLPSNQIRALQFDPQGNLWVCTSNAGVAMYDGKRFTNYLDDGNLFKTLNIGFPTLAFDAEGAVWLAVGPHIFRLEGGVFRHKVAALGLAANTVMSVGNFEGRLWMFSNQGAFVWDGKSFVRPQLPHSDEIDEATFTFARTDERGNFWGFAQERGTGTGRIVSLKGQQWRVLPPFPGGYTLGALNAVMEDSKGILWFAFTGVGALKYDGQEWHAFNTDNGMPINQLTSILEDYEGNIWIGTQGAGIVRMPIGGFINFLPESGLPGAVAFGIYEDRQGNMWMGTSTDGFAKYDGKTLKSSNKAWNGQLNRINNFYDLGNGEMMVITRNAGIYKYNERRETLENVNQQLGLPNNFVGGSGVFDDDKGRHLLLTWTGPGVVIYDSQWKQVGAFGRAQGLANINVQGVEQDASGNYWVATIAGLYMCTQDTCVQKTIPELPSLGIMLQMGKDSKGRIWVASYDKGLFCVNERGEIRRFDASAGDPLGLLYSLTIDKQDNIWLGTQRGVNKVVTDGQGAVKEVVNYGSADGLVQLEMNGASAFTDSKGRLWFGHLSGISMFGDVQKEASKPPITAITGLLLASQETNWADSAYTDYHRGVVPWYGLPQGLVLPYDKNYLSFTFASLSHQAPEKIRRQWMLEGLDDAWLEPSTRTEATYSNLPYGEYTFKVRTMNGQGVWGEPQAYSFEITPPFWETWLFKIAATLVLGGTVYGAVRARIQAIKAKKEELERLVKERTLQLEQKNSEVMLKNTELEQQKEEIMAQHEEIETQNVALNMAYKEIAENNASIKSSITYAKRIQEAMLPSMSRINSAFPESFVLYKPRDIVSGDFYWFSELQNQAGQGQYLLAVADCTGHGVPGAFMSMAGDAYLTLAVKNQQLADPAEILASLDRNISASLKQEGGENKDGMDIALCNWCPERRIMRFAGAKNGLIYIQNGELHQIKGSKSPIGGHVQGVSKLYFTEEIEVNTPTAFYMFSDGYVDQFGGPDDRKFMIKQFRALLQDIYQLPMRQQQQVLEDQLHAWMGKHRQIDDILVIGFRVG